MVTTADLITLIVVVAIVIGFAAWWYRRSPGGAAPGRQRAALRPWSGELGKRPEKMSDAELEQWFRKAFELAPGKDQVIDNAVRKHGSRRQALEELLFEHAYKLNR